MEFPWAGGGDQIRVHCGGQRGLVCVGNSEEEVRTHPCDGEGVGPSSQTEPGLDEKKDFDLPTGSRIELPYSVDP